MPDDYGTMTCPYCDMVLTIEGDYQVVSDSVSTPDSLLEMVEILVESLDVDSAVKLIEKYESSDGYPAHIWFLNGFVEYFENMDFDKAISSWKNAFHSSRDAPSFGEYSKLIGYTTVARSIYGLAEEVQDVEISDYFDEFIKEEFSTEYLVPFYIQQFIGASCALTDLGSDNLYYLIYFSYCGIMYEPSCIEVYKLCKGVLEVLNENFGEHLTEAHTHVYSRIIAAIDEVTEDMSDEELINAVSYWNGDNIHALHDYLNAIFNSLPTQKPKTRNILSSIFRNSSSKEGKMGEDTEALSYVRAYLYPES